ncbi:hypothetical protein [Staphylothermus hellenicus]|uniref:Uncharacterized protein n=1 Tax=Staphylothermus hellenicus (strain DSM 12710 / JCM 10830 / BK20S6-10-b1 / P8) TaxID=591019 RepID=D7DC02_STAHD|nr:hypothetical protein [Staphylothermus hellenicus]ADI31699.1 hypothetical protein Shell_0572 [Staphylothermus hellenicus DSM 12710]
MSLTTKKINDELFNTVIDFGDIKLTAHEILEIINEEKEKLYKQYGAKNFNELLELIRTNRIGLSSVFNIMRRLEVLNEMERIVYEDILAVKE